MAWNLAVMLTEAVSKHEDGHYDRKGRAGVIDILTT